MQLDAGPLIAGIIFGSIGFVAFVYGKKQSSWKPMAIGAALMGFTYLVPGLFPQLAVGTALTAALFLFRD